MEFKNIVDSLEHKSILITGSTGFLAKIFIEKVLRVQPNVKKLFLLLRAADSNSATHRLHNEVIGKEVFRVLREKWGMGFDSFISNKVTPIAGDSSCVNLGIKDSDLREEMWREVGIVVNLAANTNFGERYDVALGINTYGAKHVLDFAKKCVKLEMLLHVSTAYVCGEKSGLILEKPFKMGETLNGTSGLDIEQELKLVEERLNELRDQETTKVAETIAMKEFGLKRARLYGWPNTYVFTKAMGEMLIGEQRGNVPLVIIRPTIITSTYKEPFPGWVEGIRTIDVVVVGYGKGKLTCFLGHPESIIDLIPGDMVVNAMVVAMVGHKNHQPLDFIYQVGSSLKNPMKSIILREYLYSYFSKNPWINENNGEPVKVSKVAIFTTVANFHRYISMRYRLPLKRDYEKGHFMKMVMYFAEINGVFVVADDKVSPTIEGLQLANAVFCQYFHDIYSDLTRKINFVMRLVELYKPYILFEGRFDDLNTKMLRMAARENEVDGDTFYFDPKCIDWEDYFINIHIPGVVKYVFK